MTLSFLKKIFGPASQPQRKKPLRGRRLGMECLENRELLSVTTLSEFANFRDMYADLNLSANMTDYNIIDLDALNSTEAGLRQALLNAGSTTQDSIIVLWGTDFSLDGREISVLSSNSPLGTNMGSVTIMAAQGQFTIDAQNQSRIFEINSVDVSFAGIHFENGRTTLTSTTANQLWSGGAIRSENGNIVIVNSEFNDNICTGTRGSGGAIYAQGGSLSIYGSEFTGNVATASSTFGGAIYANGGSVYVASSTFLYNEAYDGGAIAGAAGTTIEVADSTFHRNAARHDGGAIYSLGTLLTVRDTVISYNEYVHYGGGIYKGGGLLEIYDSEIHSQYILDGKVPASTARGGGVCSTGNMTIDNSEVWGNISRNGGGVYCGASNTVATISNSTVYGNTATGNGGGVYGTTSSSTLNIIDSIIEQNNAATSGGGIYSAARLNVSGTESSGSKSTKIQNNSANSGGGIYVTAASTITGVDIIDNEARTGTGGGIYASSATQIVTSRIAGNYAGTDGGGLYVTGTASTMLNSVVMGNFAQGYGGGIYGGFRTITNATIAGNVSFGGTNAGRGGGIYVASGSLTLQNSILSGNLSTGATGSHEIWISTGTGVSGTLSYSLLDDDRVAGGRAFVNGGNNILNVSAYFVDFTPPVNITSPASWVNQWRGWDLNLSPLSTATDRGNSQLLPAGLNLDVEGKYRVHGQHVDMGAYEHSVFAPLAVQRLC